MARKTKTIVVSADNRDKGKTFFVTEMPAMSAEKWATRALSAMARSGIELPAEVMNAGIAGIVVIGAKALLSVDFVEAEPLLDEMMACVQFVPDPSKPDVLRRVHDDDIEEVSTILLLRNEVIELHLGFSIAAGLSKLGSAAKRGPSSSDIPTSPEP